MTTYEDEELAFFESLISPWVTAYKYADCAYVGFKTDNGLRLFTGRIVLTPFNLTPPVVPFYLDSATLVAGRFVLDVTEHDVSQMLVRLRKGEMLGADGAIVPIQPDSHLNIYCSPTRYPFVADNIRVPNIKASGISRHKLLQDIKRHLDIDWELKSGSVPFDSFDDLLRHCALPIQSETGDSTSLELVAGCPLIITDKSVINNGLAKIECRMPTTLDVAAIQLGYKVIHGNGNIERRESMDGSRLSWKQENDANIGSIRINVGDAHMVQAFASYAGTAQHQGWILDPSKSLNPRFAIHQIFDSDLELLKRQLFKPETDKAHMFEQAVSILLNLTGFTTTTYGRIPKLQKGPDIIAISPAGNVGVVECTLGLINENDKLAKLTQRTKLIRDKLNGTGYAHVQILPVVVTPLSRNEITANLEEAGKLGIAVVCKEDIEGMLGQTSLPPNPDKWFNDARGLIPNMTGMPL